MAYLIFPTIGIKHARNNVLSQLLELKLIFFLYFLYSIDLLQHRQPLLNYLSEKLEFDFALTFA